jgi:hypothetical protein
MTKPKMQHRHYVLIAEAIANAPICDDCRMEVVSQFAAALRGTNERFDCERFVAAAMGKPSNGRDNAGS